MRLIKKNDYYYLKHSFRKNGKVITKERYLGREIPKNIEEIKQDLQKESQKLLYVKLEKIQTSFQQEWKRYPESAKQREEEEIAIDFTYNTNAIEGSTITLEETREIIIDKIAPNKSLKDIRETEAHFKTFLEMLRKPEKISKELLLRWHKDLFEETRKYYPHGWKGTAIRWCLHGLWRNVCYGFFSKISVAARERDACRR